MSSSRGPMWRRTKGMSRSTSIESRLVMMLACDPRKMTTALFVTQLLGNFVEVNVSSDHGENTLNGHVWAFEE